MKVTINSNQIVKYFFSDLLLLSLHFHAVKVSAKMKCNQMFIELSIIIVQKIPKLYLEYEMKDKGRFRFPCTFWCIDYLSKNIESCNSLYGNKNFNFDYASQKHFFDWWEAMKPGNDELIPQLSKLSRKEMMKSSLLQNQGIITLYLWPEFHCHMLLWIQNICFSVLNLIRRPAIYFPDFN